PEYYVLGRWPHVHRTSADRPRNAGEISLNIAVPRWCARGAAVLVCVGLAACGGQRRAAAWPEPGGNLASTRSVAAGPINAVPVRRLRVAWRFRFPDTPTFSGVDSATPLVLDGRVYVQTLQSNVYALDAGTGAVIWRRKFSRPSGGPNGLATDGSRLF